MDIQLVRDSSTSVASVYQRESTVNQRGSVAQRGGRYAV